MILLEKIFLLREVALFKEVSYELLADLASYAEEERVSAKQMIIRKNEMGDTLYIIVSGRVTVTDEGRVLAELRDLEIFGELAVLSPEPRSASVEAAEDTLLLKLQRQDLLDHFSMDPGLTMGIISELCSGSAR